jgi:hypothetical protein
MVIPIFRIFDEAKAREFYIDWLGFQSDWEHRFADNAPLYMQVSRKFDCGEVRLHLSEHHGDACPGSKAFIEFQNVEELHRELIEKDYKYNKPGVEHAPWNAKTLTVIDPFHNQLMFNESL